MNNTTQHNSGFMLLLFYNILKIIFSNIVRFHSQCCTILVIVYAEQQVIVNHSMHIFTRHNIFQNNFISSVQTNLGIKLNLKSKYLLKR